MNNSDVVESLLDWKGGWGARALFDDAVSRYLNYEDQDISLAKKVIQNSSGYSAIRQLKNYLKLTGFKLDISSVPKKLSPNVKQIIRLADIRDIPYEISPDFWLDRLCEHLNANRANLTERITQSLSNDQLPTGEPKHLIQTWSFPVISKLLSLDNDPIEVSYVEDEIARLCWKRWYLNSKNFPILLEIPDRSGLNSSQWLVWRLLHDATHLLHIQKFPKADSYLNPLWLLTLEATAMTTEYEFLNLIDYGKDIPKPVNYPFNLFNIKTVLLIGLLERALRLDYDIAVHLNAQFIDDWITQTKRRTGLTLNCYSFVDEFYGLPGFCAGYMLGLNTLRNEQDKLSIISGVKSLDFLNLNSSDELSISPLTDIPTQRPQHPIYIQSVGSSDSTCFFNLINPFTNRCDHIAAQASVSVALSPYQRGIHMSRLQEILNNLDIREKWNSLVEVADFIAIQARELQNSEKSEVNLIVNSYIETFNSKSKTRSKQPVLMTANCTLSDSTLLHSIGLSIKVMTACPCTMKYSRIKAEKNLKSSLGGYFDESIMQNIPPTFTHSQKGILSVKISSSNNLISFHNLYLCVFRVAHLVESVLKRPDEHFLVQKTHNKPQFCEDLCRDVAVSVASEISADDLLEVFVELDESIHPHKAFAKLVIKASDAWYHHY
ncbi:MAG: GTP cyclohydrolase I FolE2 [Limnoraphis sp. WC205]|nr:GTP cyclohydrolase I FolE2 [Limnoraphis sp. WC205]